MTRGVPQSVQRQWADLLEGAGVDEGPAENLVALVAADPRVSSITVDGAEAARDVIVAAARLLDEFDLTGAELSQDRDEELKELLLVALRYGLVEEAPVESVTADPDAHALAELPTIADPLKSSDPVVQELALQILREADDRTVEGLVTDSEALRTRLEALEDSSVTAVALGAGSVLERISTPGVGPGEDVPEEPDLLADLRERRREREADAGNGGGDGTEDDTDETTDDGTDHAS